MIHRQLINPRSNICSRVGRKLSSELLNTVRQIWEVLKSGKMEPCGEVSEKVSFVDTY
jgi:hypothetical protein